MNFFGLQFLDILGLNVEEIWECQWKKWRLDNTNGVQDFLKSNYQFQPSMNKNSLIEKIKRELFGVVDCSLEVPEEMYPYFEDFPLIFKNCEVGRDDSSRTQQITTQTQKNAHFHFQA